MAERLCALAACASALGDIPELTELPEQGIGTFRRRIRGGGPPVFREWRLFRVTVAVTDHTAVSKVANKRRHRDTMLMRDGP